ncbi:MAG: VRR-NUC domain-containing protein [Candidatus Nanohalobium sp.]
MGDKRLFSYPKEDCRYRCLARNLWFSLFLFFGVMGVIDPDPLSRLELLSYFIPLMIYWTPIFQLRFKLASIPAWKRWAYFGILFVPYVGAFLLVILVLRQAISRGKNDSVYEEESSPSKTEEKTKSSEEEQFEHLDQKDDSSTSKAKQKSSSAAENSNGSSSYNGDLQDKSKDEDNTEDEDLLKITLTDLPNISIASIEGEGSSYEYALSPSSEFILCYQDGHRDATGEKEQWVDGEVVLLEIVEIVSEDILNGRKVAKFDFDRPLSADVNDGGEWLVVNSNSNVKEDSIKWFDKENLEAEYEFDVNIMNSKISSDGISVLVTAPAYSTVYCFQNGVKEWEKKISDDLPFRIMDIEFIPEEEEIRLESHDENSGFTMSYTGEIIDDSVINDDKNRSVKNYDGSLPEDRGSFPKKSYHSSLKFSEEEKESIRDRFRKNKVEIIRKEEELEYVGTKNTSYRSSFLVQRNDGVLPLEKSVKHYYENKGWRVSRSLTEKENSVVNIFSDDSSLDIPEEETIDENVYSFLKTHSRGLPDLFGYNPSENQFYFIEIKSQNDTLSLVQKKWYNEFLELEPEIEYILHSVEAKTIKPRTLENVPLKGISHRGIPLSYFNSISKNENLDLEPEPDNQHDPLAVKVIHDGKFIGYLPQNLNYKEIVIEAIKEGDYNAKITHFHRADNKDEYGVFMKIDFLRSD